MGGHQRRRGLERRQDQGRHQARHWFGRSGARRRRRGAGQQFHELRLLGRGSRKRVDWFDRGRDDHQLYVITPGKGQYVRPVAVNLQVATALTYPNDPVITITKPQDGTAITQRQRNSKFTFSGFALDRNPITNPASQTLGPGCSGCAGATGALGTQARGAGIQGIIANIDSVSATPGDNSPLGLFGTLCTSCIYGVPLVSNAGFVNTPGRPAASIVTRNYGSQYDFSGWTVSLNPQLLSPGWHTLYVTAVSSITGKRTTTSSTFNVLDMTHLKIQP